MINQNIISTSRTVIVYFSVICICLLGMSFVNKKSIANTYQIVSANFFISGSENVNSLKLQIENSNCEGKFIIEDRQLENISDLNFSFSTHQIIADNQPLAEALKVALKEKNCNEISFTQKQLMILPVMKMVHLLGEIKIGNETHTVPMQIHYTIEEDGSMILHAKQFIKLSEFGIVLPKIKSSKAVQEITINIALKLTKEPANFASLTPN